MFGFITVTTCLGSAKKKHGYKANGDVVSGRCICGGEWVGLANSLKRGNTKSCGCIPHGTKPDDNRELSAINSLFRSYQRHARSKIRDWQFTKDTFISLIKGNCYYCGSPPNSVCRKIPRGPRKTGSSVTYNGLDRKDNDIGYTTDNVVTCCSICNYAKEH